MRIKSRKQRELEYAEEYGSISLDPYERLKKRYGDKFNEDALIAAKDRLDEAKNNLEYRCIRFTFYEEPKQSHRPRTNYKFHSLYVPNAKDNYEAIKTFVEDLDETLKVIDMPMKIKLTAYAAMPESVNVVDAILYETENDYAIGKPDFDNILKAYTDMIQKNIILDDDLVVSSSFDKYFSMKPRVILDIIYPNGLITEHLYKAITHRVSYLKLDNKLEAKLLVTPYKTKKNKLVRK